MAITYQYFSQYNQKEQAGGNTYPEDSVYNTGFDEEREDSVYPRSALGVGTLRVFGPVGYEFLDVLSIEPSTYI